MKFDLRSGTTPTIEIGYWNDWQEAQDNEEFENTVNRFVQHRFYTWVAQDVRFSRDRESLPQFIYKHFVLFSECCHFSWNSFGSQFLYTR